MKEFFVKAKYFALGGRPFVTIRRRMLECEFTQFCEDYSSGEYCDIVELHVERIVTDEN